MSDWAPKRFWRATRVEQVDGQGHQVLLDDRPLRTPGKAPLILPTAELANLLAQEWDAQTEMVDPATMPMTRMANSAIDRIGAQRDDVIGYIAGYGDTDLLCYRADHPEALIERQRQGWDPMLDWAELTYGARLRPTRGIMPIDQPPEALAVLRAAVEAWDDFGLMGLHDLVSLTGSLVLGLAATHRDQAPHDIWAVSRIDELWQIAQWGHDEEAADVASRKEAAFLAAHRFFHAAR